MTLSACIVIVHALANSTNSVSVQLSIPHNKMHLLSQSSCLCSDGDSCSAGLYSVGHAYGVFSSISYGMYCSSPPKNEHVMLLTSDMALDVMGNNAIDLVSNDSPCCRMRSCLLHVCPRLLQHLASSIIAIAGHVLHKAALADTLPQHGFVCLTTVAGPMWCLCRSWSR